MPRIKEPLSVSYDSISRPVALSIARDVMQLTGVGQNVPIYLTNEFETINQPNAPGQQLIGGDEVQFESNQRMRVSVTERIKHNSILNDPTRSNEEPPFFEDRRIGLSLRPNYVQSELTFEFKYTAATRQQAINWRDTITSARAEERESIQHQIHYQVPIHDAVWARLAHLHELREKIAGYGQTFAEYVKEHLLCDLVPLGTKDHDLKKITLAINEYQVQAQGWFEFDEVPQETKTDGNSTWEIQFTYRAVYKRMRNFYIAHPLMIHQTHIRKEFYSKRRNWSVEEVRKYGPIGIRALDVLDGNEDSLPPPVDGVRVPYYDDWIPGFHNQPPVTIPAISWMIQLDPKDPQDIISLRQTPFVKLTKEVDDYFVAVHQNLNRRSGGSCLVTLYQNDTPMSEDVLEIDEHLNVRSRKPLDLRQAYHLRISFPVHWPTFTQQAIDTMSTHWAATLQVFQSIVPDLDVEYARTLLLDDDSLPYDYMEWFYTWLRNRGIGYPEGPGGGCVPGGPNWPGWGGSDGDNGVGPGKGHHRRRSLRYVMFLAIVNMQQTET